MGRLRLNRMQKIMLGFFIVVWISLVVILVAAPEVFEQALRLPANNGRMFELSFLVALAAFLVFLGFGVVRRWRCTFWFIVVAFILGVLRVPAAALQLTGVLRADVPTWYVLLQALIGLIQLAIGLAMLVGYRRAGVWGSF